MCFTTSTSGDGVQVVLEVGRHSLSLVIFVDFID